MKLKEWPEYNSGHFYHYLLHYRPRYFGGKTLVTCVQITLFLVIFHFFGNLKYNLGQLKYSIPKDVRVTKENLCFSMVYTPFIHLFGIMKSALVLSMFLFFSGFSQAQNAPKVRKKFLVVGVNALSYKGSLQNSYARWTPGIQVGLRFQKKKNLNGMLSATFGKVIGEDRTYVKPSRFSDQIQPVSRFQTSVFSLQYEAQFLLFRHKGLRIFTSLGLGLFRYEPQDWDGNSLVEKDRTRNKDESYSKNAIQFPIQFGFQYWFPNEMGLGFQAGWLNPVSKYIDNMSDLANNEVSDNVATIRFQFFYHLEQNSRPLPVK